MIWDMLTKLYVQMYHDHMIVLVDHDAIHDVIMLKTKSNF